MFEQLRQDLGQTGRALRRRRGFTILVTLTLALGIGASTAIFTVADTVLLAPLPYGNAGELVMIWSRWEAFDKTWVSEAEYLDYRDRLQSLDSAACFATGSNLSLTGDFEPRSVPAAFVTANLLEVFEVEPVAGRSFSAAEDIPNGPNVVMIVESLWREAYNADPRLVGETIEINRQAYTVVGIVPAGFRLPIEFRGQGARLWLPLQVNEADPVRGSHGLFTAGRLAAGHSVNDLNRELAVLTDRWTDEGLYSEAMRFEAFGLSVADEVAGKMRQALTILAGAVGFLLLIACANVAALFLTRTEERHREIVVRQALGAGRGRVFRALLTESLVLSALGGLAGLGVAFGTVRVIRLLAPAGLPRMAELAVDLRVLLFAVLLSAVTGLLFGTLPALFASRPDLAGSLRDDGRTGSGRGSQRLRGALVLAEVAVAVVLLVSAGLLMRSFAALQSIDPGFRSDGVLAIDLSLPRAAYAEDEAVIDFYDRLRHNVDALPGVERAAFVRALPLATTIGDAGLDVEGRPEDPGGLNPKGDWQVVSPDYFETLGIRLVRGRFFTDQDRVDSAPVAVINEHLAAAYWPGENPIGRRIRAGGEQDWRTVVGIAGAVRHNGVDGQVKTKFYVPDAQFGAIFGVRRSMTLVARSSVDPYSLVGALRAEIARLDPRLPVTNVRTLDDVMSTAVAQPRFVMWLMGSFAALALALAAIGIYGVLSFSVNRRIREIGIRMALGAGRAEIRWLVLRYGLRLTAAGTLLGLLGAFGTTRLLEGLLHGVEPLDPLSFAATAATLLPVALGAILWPARRATRVEPIQSLHYE